MFSNTFFIVKIDKFHILTLYILSSTSESGEGRKWVEGTIEKIKLITSEKKNDLLYLLMKKNFFTLL